MYLCCSTKVPPDTILLLCDDEFLNILLHFLDANPKADVFVMIRVIRMIQCAATSMQFAASKFQFLQRLSLVVSYI